MRDDLIERLRRPLPICPFSINAPPHNMQPDDPCTVCGGLGTPDAKDKCRGADTRIMDEAAAEIERLREAVEQAAAGINYINGRLSAAQARAEAAEGAWQPIETAPKDGRALDLWTKYGERITDATWDARGGWVHWAMGGFETMGWERIDGSPTHWMPLPPPPADAISRGDHLNRESER